MRKGVYIMTEERKIAEEETRKIIEAIRQGGDEKILRIAALSYTKGLADGAQIERSQRTA